MQSGHRWDMRDLWTSAMFVFLLGVLTHAESLGYWFTSYDSLALIETSRITSLADVWEVLTEPLMYGTSYVRFGEFYRPVVNLTYALDYALWGLDPFGYHLTNVLLHGLAAVLVVLTVRSLTESIPAGALTGALFAIHPLSVDTVPGVSRRQDVLLAVFGLLMLWLFVEGVRRDSKRLRAGAALAYALALLSKETAIVLGPLAFVWVVLRQPSLRRWKTYRRATHKILPLAAVAVAYLAVRIAVLGGIGGYTHEPPLSKVLLFPFQYVLALTYQAHVFGVLADLSLPLFFVFVIGVPVLYVALLHRDRSLHKLSTSRLLLVALAVVGFVALIATVVFPNVALPIRLNDGRHVSWYATSVVFAVATASAIGAILPSTRLFDVEHRRLGLFFLVWIALPVPVFFVGRQFSFRNAYFFVIPFLALLATYLVGVLPRLDRETVLPKGGTDAAVVLVVLVVLVPSVAASPLFYTDSEWSEVGDVTRQTLAAVEDSVSDTEETTPVVVHEMPTRVRHDPKRLGQARKPTILQPHSLRSWLVLQDHENPVTVEDFRSFNTTPRSVSTNETRQGEKLVVHLHYEWERDTATRAVENESVTPKRRSPRESIARPSSSVTSAVRGFWKKWNVDAAIYLTSRESRSV